MRAILLGLIFCFSLQAAPIGQTNSRLLIDFPQGNPAEARRLMSWLTHRGYDVAGVNRQKHQIEVITSDAGVRALRAQGISIRMIETHAQGMENVSNLDPRYLNPQKVTEKLKSLNQAYPNLTRLEKIGESLEGRPILAMLISTTPEASDRRALNKPSIIFDGLHHAREVMTAEIVVDVAETLLRKVEDDNAKALHILENWNVWIVPMLNVDGNNIVWTKDNWWRKNAHTQGSSVHGVDLNRNYPYRWAQCDGSSGSKDSEVYRGESAASEPETQSLIRLADRVQPAASLSYHSYSEFVLYPFGCDRELTGEHELLERVGKELAARLPSDSGRGFYTSGTPWQILYGVDGDSMNYMFAAFGALAYTFEVNQAFQPSYDLREPTLLKHRGAWSYFLNRVSQNMLHLKVVDGKTGQNVQAELAVNTIKHAKGEKPFHTNAAGNYFKTLDPGHYVISAKAANGQVGEVSVDMKGAPQQITLEVH